MVCRYEYTKERTSPEELLALAQTSRDLCVLRELAENPKTPIEALRILITDDLFARWTYKRTEDEKISAGCVFTDLIRGLGHREPLEPELAELLYQRESGYRHNYHIFTALVAMVQNPTTPQDILDRIFDQFSGDRNIRAEFDERWEREWEDRQAV